MGGINDKGFRSTTYKELAEKAKEKLEQANAEVKRVFLSYNRTNKNIAEEIGKYLRSHGVDAWVDSWEMFAGESITDKIASAIKNASVFVILLSTYSVKSNFVKEELRIALNLRLQDPSYKIVPVLLEECDIPLQLQDLTRIDFIQGSKDSLEALLRTIKGISLKPPLVKDHSS